MADRYAAARACSGTITARCAMPNSVRQSPGISPSEALRASRLVKTAIFVVFVATYRKRWPRKIWPDYY